MITFVNKNKYLVYLKIYLFFLSFVTIFFLCSLHQVGTNNAVSEWVINYQGGFVRRGLIGELFFQISKFTHLNLRLIILFFEIIFYCLYFYFTFNFIKKINFSSIDLLAFFCPIFLFASIADFEMLGRKEVIFFIFIIIFFSNLNNIYLINKKYLLFFILPLIILTYETVIFYLIFIGFVFLIKKNLNFKDLFKVIIYFFPSIIVTFLIFYNPQSKINNSIMCNALETINEKCGLAAAFTTKHITDHIAEVNWKIFSIVKYFLLLLFSYFPILFLSFNVKYNKNMVNSFIIKIPFYLIFIIINLTTFIMYFIAVDSARWSVISYTSSYFFFYALLKENFIILKPNSFYIRFNNYLDKKIYLLILVILLFGFSWNFKPTPNESIGTIPLYRTLIKFTHIHWYHANFKIFNN